MTDNQIVLEKLKIFRNLNKFSDSAWQERGLNPSATEMSNRLEKLFDECTDDLIEAVTKSFSSRQLKIILKIKLENINSSDYDTEEREFICDYFNQLSNIVSFDF